MMARMAMLDELDVASQREILHGLLCSVVIYPQKGEKVGPTLSRDRLGLSGAEVRQSGLPLAPYEAGDRNPQ
jgi:hypothetical protein